MRGKSSSSPMDGNNVTPVLGSSLRPWIGGAPVSMWFELFSPCQISRVCNSKAGSFHRNDIYVQQRGSWLFRLVWSQIYHVYATASDDFAIGSWIMVEALNSLGSYSSLINPSSGFKMWNLFGNASGSSNPPWKVNWALSLRRSCESSYISRLRIKSPSLALTNLLHFLLLPTAELEMTGVSRIGSTRFLFLRVCERTEFLLYSDKAGDLGERDFTISNSNVFDFGRRK